MEMDFSDPFPIGSLSITHQCVTLQPEPVGNSALISLPVVKVSAEVLLQAVPVQAEPPFPFSIH